MVLFQKFLSLVSCSAAVVTHASIEPQTLEVTGILQENRLNDCNWLDRRRSKRGKKKWIQGGGLGQGKVC